MLFWHKHNLDKSLTDLANFTPFPGKCYIYYHVVQCISKRDFVIFYVLSDYCNGKCTYTYMCIICFTLIQNSTLCTCSWMYSVHPIICGTVCQLQVIMCSLSIML